MLPGYGSQINRYARYLALGSQIAASMLIPVFLGWWMDTRFETEPWFMLLGIVLGMVMLITTLYKLIAEIKTREK